MRGRDMHRARIVASIAATAISLACGTNYVYSAWAPQFADRLKLSATESNLIGLAGNMGMYLVGFPIGVFIDSRGPRPAVIGGMILLGLGYFPLHEVYDAGSGPVSFLCFFSFLTGLGSCMAFSAAMKASALNWPDHRGTATAFPLAAFGLSAFFFSTLGALLFPGDTSSFLMLLASGTSGIVFIAFFFLRVLPHHVYHSLQTSDSAISHRSRKDSTSNDRITPNGQRTQSPEPGMSSSAVGTDMDPARSSQEHVEALEHEATNNIQSEANAPDGALDEGNSDESSSLMSHASSLPGEILVQSSVDMDRSHRVDIRGLRILSSSRFWQLFTLMGLLSGVGLMTINNMGNVVKALWSRYDPLADEASVVQIQQMHVSILSLCSFSGRLLSGVGSDFLVKVLHANRLWCIAIASVIFFMAQFCAISITNPHLLGFVSGFSGLGYGFLFGVFPSIVAETFGIHGLSQNWGFITLAPAISGNIFNIFYGRIYDEHSIIEPGGQRTCPDGLECYRPAYITTLCASVAGLVLCLWIIQRDRDGDATKGKGEEED